MMVIVLLAGFLLLLALKLCWQLGYIYIQKSRRLYRWSGQTNPFGEFI